MRYGKVILAALGLALVSTAALPQPVNPYVLTSAKIAAALGYTPVNPASYGTGVATALGVNVGSAGAVVVNGGVLGTPSDLGGAWTAYTPTLACGSGTLTSATGAGRWKAIGKLYHIQLKVSISTLGTCGSFITATLPNSTTAAADGAMTGGENAVAGSTFTGRFSATTGTIIMQRYDGTLGFANNYVVAFNGLYEAQ